MEIKRGRPRIHQNESDRFRKLRQQAKKDGKKDVNIWLTSKQKELLDRLCEGLKIPQAEAIGYLLECAYDRELPNLTHYPDSASDLEINRQLSED